MKIRCNSWIKGLHEPKIIGHKEPYNDDSISDGACDACVKEMKKKGWL